MRLAVDDAGAGFASLMHILKLAPDFIKLDRDLGIDHGQGFHLARPGPPDALRKAAREGAARIGQDLLAAAPLTAVAS